MNAMILASAQFDTSGFLLFMAIASAMVVGIFVGLHKLRGGSAKTEQSESVNSSVTPATTPPETAPSSVGTGVPVCDMCSHPIREPDGYLLTTREVVTNPEYWEFMFSTAWADMLRSPDAPTRRPALAQRQAAQATPWLLCESCAKRLGTAVPKTRAYAERWWKEGRRFVPPGSGPVDVREVRQSRTSQQVVDSGVPMASHLYLIGAGFTPSAEDALPAFDGMISLHPPLVRRHFNRVPMEVFPAEGGNLAALSQAIEQVQRENSGAFCVDSITLNKATGRHLALVAVWIGEAATATKAVLGKS